MPVFRTIFVDLFNTLVSVGRVPETVGRFTADVLGVDRDTWNAVCFDSEHDICTPTTHLSVIQKLAHKLDPAIPMERIVEATQHRQARFDHALMHIDEGILSALGHLKERGLRLCLVSNASTDEVRAWSHSPLSDLFDQAIFSCHCGMQKPNPGIYQHALDNMRVDSGDCLYVGDGGSSEFIGASRARLTTVFSRHFCDPQHIQKVREDQGHAISHEIAHLAEIRQLGEF